MRRGFLICLLCIIAVGPLKAAERPAIQLESVVRGLENPLYLTHDGTQRIFVCEQPGRVRLIDGGKLQKQAYLDIEPEVYDQGECGFLSVAFHPKFAENGYFYVNYTTRRGRQIKTVISEFKTDPKATSVDSKTERVIMTIDQPQSNHNGGQLQFGPDGYFYIGMGDGGNGGDGGQGHHEPGGNAQYPGTLLGKMLRIDVNERTKYGIPKDNPFVDKPGWRPEIWAWGLRNPWRFCFDRETGICYAADVGQDLWEEVDIIEKGRNYGWRIREGTHDFRPREAGAKVIDPIAEYGHDVGLSITGGYVYRGKGIPALQGVYLYADYSSGRFWGLRYVDGKVQWNSELAVQLPNGQPARNKISPAGFGEDLAGEIYVCDHQRGHVYKIVKGKPE